jgi:hypothetical protein
MFGTFEMQRVWLGTEKNFIRGVYMNEVGYETDQEGKNAGFIDGQSFTGH